MKSKKGFAVSSILYPAFIIIITLVMIILLMLIQSTFSMNKVTNETQGDLSDNNTMKSLKESLTQVLKEIPKSTKYEASDGTIKGLTTTANITHWTGKFYVKSDGTEMAYIDNGKYCAFKVGNMSGVAVYNSGECIQKLATEMNCSELSDLSGASSAELFAASHPVGSIYISTDSKNPNDTYNGNAGTWAVYGEGRVLVGMGTATDSNGNTMTFSSTQNSSGGKYTYSLSVANMPEHTHSVTPAGTVSSTFSGNSGTTSTAGDHYHSATATGSVSSSFGGYSGTTTSNGAHTHDVGMNVSFTVGNGTGGGSSGIPAGEPSWGSYYPAHWFYLNVENGGAHNHSYVASGGVSSTFYGATTTSSTTGNHTHNFTPAGTVSSTFTGVSTSTSSTGSGTAFNIQNPYVVVYMWIRTA